MPKRERREQRKIHQIFIGCPFQKSVRKRYDRLKAEIERETPLAVVLADTTAIRSTESLLRHITDRIRESSSCIFDVTGGNPNVSLEVGIAHALPVDFVLTMSTRRSRAAGVREARPIISDLQGRNRIEYKSYAGLREALRTRYLSRLPYMKRWHDFRRKNRALEAPALALLREIRDDGDVSRTRVEALLDGTGIDARRFLDEMTRARLIELRRGGRDRIGLARERGEE